MYAMLWQWNYILNESFQSEQAKLLHLVTTILELTLLERLRYSKRHCFKYKLSKYILSMHSLNMSLRNIFLGNLIINMYILIINTVELRCIILNVCLLHYKIWLSHGDVLSHFVFLWTFLFISRQIILGIHLGFHSKIYHLLRILQT